jgi:general secretion pathway protein D
LILEPLHLGYVVKDEVLKITSEQAKAGQVYTVTYNVADLVIPIPNFVGGPNMGLAGAYRDAMGTVMGGGNPGGLMSTPMSVVASNRDSKQMGAINPQVLAQMAGNTGVGANGQQSTNSGFGGPGGAGGGANADFDAVMDLIRTTVQPNTWDEVGGPGTMSKFETNLSLVISQTQEVHEEIVDLLEQLRRMQDLQVTIEVRFITLSDSFFEKIGVDFDFNILQNVQNPTAAGFSPVTTVNVGGNTYNTRLYGGTGNGTAVAGLQSTGSTGIGSTPLFTSDLDIPFTQGSYALATPQFGSYDVTAGAQLGFAILSDVEAYFFISAAQGDKRTNVLQAPKVTLFNGQQAFVSDTSQTPFVISVVPVVGDFAAAEQPVIVVLSEGTFMTVQAVVSSDRRFVRLTIVPFFSKITNVSEFTFTGSTTTTVDSTATGLTNPVTGDPFSNSNASSSVTTGTTVQLPTFSFVTVTTTVSVPDGGTVLLGGIKRLSEDREEYGVPILDKIPYLNRLFKNTSIGRDTSSLMMMVTPRIIVEEEEEEKMGVPQE